MITPPQTLAQALEGLVGRALNTVVFVEDYVQFGFNGPGLTAYTRPTVRSESKELTWEEAGYCDTLRNLIGCPVERTAVDDREAVIFFKRGNAISISLRDEDYSGPEALEFSLDNTRNWVV